MITSKDIKGVSFGSIQPSFVGSFMRFLVFNVGFFLRYTSSRFVNAIGQVIRTSLNAYQFFLNLSVSYNEENLM